MDATSFPPAARIQVAAVVAQQAALAEVEWRLLQDQQSHQQQHAQLAQYLDERHREISFQEEGLAESHAEIDRQRRDTDAHLRLSYQQLQSQSSQLDRRERTTLAERDALRQLRQRFLKRWKRHWSTERARLSQQATSQQREAERLVRERQRFEQFRLKFNTQMELERQQLREQHQECEAARQALRHERQASESARQQLIHLESSVEQLRTESDALERRIAHQRTLLSSLQPAPASVPAPTTVQEPSASAHARGLEVVARDLSDQQRVLLEQCQRMDTMRHEELDIVADLEQSTCELLHQQELLRQAQQEWDAGHAARQVEREGLTRKRQQLEGQWLSYYSRVNRTQANDQRRHAELAQREQRISERESALSTLMQNWNTRRRTEADRLGAELEHCAELHAAWRERLEADHHRERSLIFEQQRIAEQTIVLEEARREFLRDNPLASEKKLQRLHRRLKESLARREAELLQRELQQQMSRDEIEESYGDLRQRTEYLRGMEVRVEENQTAQTASRYQLQQSLADRDFLRARWDDQQARYTHQIDELEKDVERIAAMLIELAPLEDAGEERQAA